MISAKDSTLITHALALNVAFLLLHLGSEQYLLLVNVAFLLLHLLLVNIAFLLLLFLSNIVC